MKQWKNDMMESLLSYKALRLHNLNTPQFRHLWLLVFWPAFGLLFSCVEKVWVNRNWTTVEWPWMDGVIPFCEWFVIPYIFWFVFLGGMVAFTLLFDKAAFRKMMYFIIITYTVTIIIYLIWPTKQELRPDISALGRDNFLTRFMAGFYEFDTNTNVCPSIHVLGSIAVLFASWHCKYFQSLPWKLFFWIWTVLISLSTVFLKQHSSLDVPPAVLLSVAAYPFAFYGDRIFARRKKMREQDTCEQVPQLIEK